jgi:hypothetical protein
VTGWTPLAKSLLESARNEAPSAAAKAKVWSGVAASFAVGGATTGAVASIAPPAAAGGGLATLASAKMLLIGALLGSAVTLGIAATTLFGRSEPLASLSPTMAIAPVALRAANETSLLSAPLPPNADSKGADAPPVEATPPLHVRPTPSTARATSTAFAAAPTAARSGTKPSSADTPPGSDVGADALMQEASWVAEARNCIRRGDPSAALTAIREARALPSHQLAPEESALEAQAIHAIARASTAPLDSARPPRP